MTPLETALGYIQRGWNPVPVRFKGKIPTAGNDWHTIRINAANVAQYFNGGQQNIGVQEGPPSNHLNDVDLDCPEARTLAPYFLPHTDAVFGRPSAMHSHRLYVSNMTGIAEGSAEQFRDPLRYRSKEETKEAMIVELRTGAGDKGAQTVFPGSIHKSGEAISWSSEGEPAQVNASDLLTCTHELAAYCLLTRYWPKAEGGRHECAMALGGLLARLGKTADQAADIVKVITLTAGDREWSDRKKAARDAVETHGKGGKTYGLPKLLESFDEKIIEKVTEWLGYQSSVKPNNSLPDLVIDHDPTATAKELAKLIAQGDHYFFNGNAPVRIAIEINAMPRAIEVTAENVRVLAHEISNPCKLVKKMWVPAEVKTDVANIYLKGLEGRWGLKHFTGIATTPILGNDGSIRSSDGYDPATGLWCHNIPALSIPEEPSGREAMAALLRIRSTFRTFPFADAARIEELGLEVVDHSKPAGMDESAFLTALLTAACRPSLKTAPGFLCDAPTFSGAGTGKGMLVKSICIIASGAPPHAFTSGHDASEFDKRLTAALVQAHPAIFLDNFNAKKISSDILASVLTENPAQVRIMGQTKMVPLHVCTFIGITGNGVEIAEDMARRLLNTRLDAKMENPEERKFKPGFLDDVFAERASLLSYLLLIWRWGRQNPGALTAGRALGSYETWAQWVRDPLLTLKLRDPVERIAEIKANDPKRRALVEIFDEWRDKHQGNVVKAAELNPEVIQLIDVRARKKDDGTLQYNRQKVARFLTQRTGTCVGGYALFRGSEHNSRHTAYYWLTKSAPAGEEPA